MPPSPLVNALIPYLVAALVALIPALVEVLRTFGRRVSFVLRCRSGWAILGLNAVAAMAAYLAVKMLFGVSNDLLTAALIGLTFPTILRSPLTFIKSVETSEARFKESALRVLADLYDQLLLIAREDADTIQANERARLAIELAQKHGADALAHQVQWRINALADAAIQARFQQALNQALAIPDPQDRGVAVALVALDVVPRSTIREWLRRRKPL